MSRAVRVVAVLAVCPSLALHYAESAEFLSTLGDMTLGAGLLDDMGGSVVTAAADIPHMLVTGGESLASLASLNPERWQQLTPEQHEHAEMSHAFFLSPFGTSPQEAQALPRLVTAFLEQRAETSSGSTGRTNKDKNGSGSSDDRGNANGSQTSNSRSSSGSRGTSFPLRGVPVMDQAQLEALAEAIAEGVANSTVYGFRAGNPLLAAAAAAKNVKLEAPSPAAAVAQLLDPLNFLQLQQQAEGDSQRQEKGEKQQEESEEQQQEESDEQQQEESEEQQQEEGKQEEQHDGVAEADEQVGLTDTVEEASETKQPQESGEQGSSPLRFWSRTNPLGYLQPLADNLYLLKWAAINPLAMLEWKALVFGQCMAIYQNEELCTRFLNVGPNAINHGGTNSPWIPSTSP
ncbi:histone H3.v1 [Cyclospora cayetanensis]|uniref:Histone H3.v1 n=1 Tax=Cyclospora cayetanensis TaxID=88456 RepID=A0A6P5WER6_9EIME|nr:histone H3.v1 [Cyclospora cayetanensis]